MICQPCKNKNHENCPARLASIADLPSTGLTPAGEAAQRSGLCACQHVGVKFDVVAE